MFAKVSPSTLSVTHVCDGEEVITGGDDGQVWIGTFADRNMAALFVNYAKDHLFHVNGERRAEKETVPARPCVWRTGCKHPAVCDQQGVCVPGGEATDCTCNDYPGADEFCTAHRVKKSSATSPSVLDRLVTVCGACETAACWQGSFMCDYAEGAGIKNLTVRDLHEKPRGENAEYWFKDGDGKIDKTLLKIYQRVTSQNR